MTAAANLGEMPDEIGFEDAIVLAVDRIDVDGLRVQAKRAKHCGPKGCLNLEVLIGRGSDSAHLLCLAAYPGKGPHYRPWMELFCLEDRPLGKAYYDTPLEFELLKALCSTLPPGGKIFVEYYSDPETVWGLSRGIPAAATRQGYLLFSLGFSWFKDWYFSEGGHEGGQKLQGEKAMDERARRRQLGRIRGEMEEFLRRSGEGNEEEGAGDFMRRARGRAKEILDLTDSAMLLR